MPDETTDGAGQARIWRRLGAELASRTLEPAQNPAFVFYVFLGPFLFGGLGIWVEVVKLVMSHTSPDYSNLITAVGTFFPAVGCSTALQLIFASMDKSDKNFVAFAMLAFCLFIFVAVLLFVNAAIHPKSVLEIGAVFSIGAIWLWWITNGRDPTYMMSDAAIGGPTNRPLSGSLAGFQA